MKYILTAILLFNVAFGQSLFGVVAGDGSNYNILNTSITASHAYSFRKLTKKYNGNCVRIRRSSDNTEQDFGFVSNYVDTSSIKTFVGSNNGFVVTWYDQSGNNRNLTTNLSSPQIISSGSFYYLNNRISIYFSGSTGLFTSSGTIENPYSLSYIAANNSASGYRRFINITQSGDSRGFHGVLNTSMANFVGNGSSWNDVNANTPTFNMGSSGTLNCLFVEVASGSSGLLPYANGTALNTKNGTAASSNGFALGASTVSASSQNWVGYGSEVIFFSSSLSSTNRTNLLSNQGTFYSITIL